MKDDQKNSINQSKYHKSNVEQITIKLNKKTDIDIIELIDLNNKQGSIIRMLKEAITLLNPTCRPVPSKYISGIQALNISCSLNTFGDWHKDSINWDNLYLLSYNETPFAMYGIEFNKQVPNQKEKYPVVNHIREILDMIYSLDFNHAKRNEK